MSNLKFEDMNLSESILCAIKDMGFEEATPIQSQSVGVIMSGRDVIGQSQTGTGKTAAFGIPVLENIDKENKKLQALILCPTRELAIQISEEFRKLLKYTDNIKVLPIYGGQPIDRQILMLKKGIQVVIGTPGRVIDHINRRTLKIETVKTIILDEADEMLDMGFREDIETILAKLNDDDRQTILFSATMSGSIMDITKRYQTDPVLVKVVHKELTVPNIEQIYFEIKEKSKLDALCRIIDMYSPELSIVFCNTKKKVDDVVGQLQGRGYFAEALHGDLKQNQRNQVMKKFRSKTLEILVATDVAARGIDVDDIDVVFNFDLPSDEEYYIHRIGRTARAGRKGTAYTFVVGKEIYKLRSIMKYTHSKIRQERLPSLSDVEELKSKQFIEKVIKTIEDGHLNKYVNLVENMIKDDYSPLDISAALMKLNLYVDPNDDFDLEPETNASDIYYDSSKYKKYNNKMTRLFINLGKKDNILVRDIVGSILGETGIPSKSIGNIDLFNEFCFVDISSSLVKEVILKLKNKKLKGRKFNIEIAQKNTTRQ